MTEKLYSTQQYLREVPATVVGSDPDAGTVTLDRTVFYPGGGGQPCDVGELWVGDDRLEVTEARPDGANVAHRVEGGLPPVGTEVRAVVDWDRRYRLMRTHTAMHALCGVVWERFRSPVTGGNMEPGAGRLDFEIEDWDSDRDRQPIQDALNDELARARPVQIDFLPRAQADRDPSLIRTKVSLLPPSLTIVRVVDIVGLDRQADGGTHVEATDEVGPVLIAKVENKGKGFRRIRIALEDQPAP
ncbi:MAG TPA: alanyl-tRNA editing protein [Nitriliruptorales bacterium]